MTPGGGTSLRSATAKVTSSFDFIIKGYGPAILAENIMFKIHKLCDVILQLQRVLDTVIKLCGASVKDIRDCFRPGQQITCGGRSITFEAHHPYSHE